MSTSRETIRDALVTLLDTALSGTVKTVTGSKAADLAGLTPLVAVLSSGSNREALTFQGTVPTFYLEVQVWVLQATTGWTNAQAEDKIDEIEALIAGVCEDNVNTANWTRVTYTGRSIVRDQTVAGVQYYLEIIPLTISTAK